MQCGNDRTAWLLEGFVASSHFAPIWRRPLCLFSKEVGSFFLSSHTRGHRRRSRGPGPPMWPSCAISLTSTHCCQGLIVGNEATFLSKDFAALPATFPLNVHLIKQKNAWNNLVPMVRFITILPSSPSPFVGNSLNRSPSFCWMLLGHMYIQWLPTCAQHPHPSKCFCFFLWRKIRIAGPAALLVTPALPQKL